jgi:hypothetical protein
MQFNESDKTNGFYFLQRKKAFRYSRPLPGTGMPITKFSLGVNNDVICKFIPPRESLVSDIPAGDRNIKKFFTV